MFETDNQRALESKLANGKAVVLFCANWCIACYQLQPVFDALSKPGVEFIKVKLEGDSNPIWDKFRIDVVPTVALFDDGKEKSRAEENAKGSCRKWLSRVVGNKNGAAAVRKAK